MVRPKICVYSGCRSDNRQAHKDYMKDVDFIAFPKPKRSYQKCKQWVEWLGREDYPIERINENTYLCTKHFVGGHGPTTQYPNPIHSPKDYVSILKPIGALDAKMSDNIQFNDDAPVSKIIDSQSIVQAPTMLMMDTEAMESSIPDIGPPFIDDISSSSQEGCDNNILGKNLKTIFTLCSSPWSLTFLDNCLKVRKMDEEVGCVLFNVIIDNYFKTRFEILGKVVTERLILSKLPEQIYDQDSLEKCLKNLEENFQICKGNPDKDYVDIYTNHQITTGFQDPISKAARSERCCLLIPASVLKLRCFYCLKQRASLRTIMYKERKKTATNVCHFKNLSKPALIDSLRKSKKIESQLRTKVQRLELRIKKLIKKEGKGVEDDHKELMDILKKRRFNHQTLK